MATRGILRLVVWLSVSVILVSGHKPSDPKQDCHKESVFSEPGKKIAIGVGVVAGGAAAVYGVPVALGAVGFKAAGIAGGSIAAGLMSTAAIANGGGVVAGSSVAILQAVGVTGLGAVGTAAVGGAGALLGGIVGALIPGGKTITIDQDILLRVKEFKDGKTEYDWIGIVIEEQITQKGLVLVAEGRGNIDNIEHVLPNDQVMFILYKVTDKKQEMEKEAGKETLGSGRVIEGKLIKQKLSGARLGASVIITWTGRCVDESIISENDIVAAEKALSDIGDFDYTIPIKEN